MENLTQMEIAAILAASAPAGAYLDGLGKTDLAALSPDEWHGFLEAVIGGYTESMRAASDRHDLPI